MIQYSEYPQKREFYTITVKTDQIGLIAAIQRNIRRYERLERQIKRSKGNSNANNH